MTLTARVCWVCGKPDGTQRAGVRQRDARARGLRGESPPWRSRPALSVCACGGWGWLDEERRFFFCAFVFSFLCFYSPPPLFSSSSHAATFRPPPFPSLVSYEYANNPVSAPQAARVSSFKTCSSLSRFQDALSLMTRVDYMSFENTTETFCNTTIVRFLRSTHRHTRSLAPGMRARSPGPPRDGNPDGAPATATAQPPSRLAAACRCEPARCYMDMESDQEGPQRMGLRPRLRTRRQRP